MCLLPWSGRACCHHGLWALASAAWSQGQQPGSCLVQSRPASSPSFRASLEPCARWGVGGAGGACPCGEGLCLLPTCFLSCVCPYALTRFILSRPLYFRSDVPASISGRAWCQSSSFASLGAARSRVPKNLPKRCPGVHLALGSDLLLTDLAFRIFETGWGPA